MFFTEVFFNFFLRGRVVERATALALAYTPSVLRALLSTGRNANSAAASRRRPQQVRKKKEEKN